jgi:hypothetical protein
MLALIVPADGHKEAEGNEESEQGQRGLENNGKIVSLFFYQGIDFAAENVTDPGGQRQQHQRQGEHKNGKVYQNCTLRPPEQKRFN